MRTESGSDSYSSAGNRVSCAHEHRMMRSIRSILAKSGILMFLVIGGNRGGSDLALASESFPLVGEPVFSADGLTLLVDALDRAPLALLRDRSQQMPSDRRLLTLRTVQDDIASSRLPVLHVTCVLPEYWAEPAVWQHFRGGPESFSGFGKDQRLKDWAGRPHTDRRAYALDNGLASSHPSTAGLPNGPSRLTVERGRATLSVEWNGVAGRVYSLEFTPDLGTAFRTLLTFINPQDRVVTIPVSPDGGSGYYRVAELLP